MKAFCKGAQRAVIASALLVGMYFLNYLLTPFLVGEPKLEVLCRPKLDQQFDSSVWRQSGLRIDGTHLLIKRSPSFGKRYEMVDDLLHSRILIGMKEGQLITALGSPDGILDKEWLMANKSPYGSEGGPAVEILNSADDVAYWSYYLADQQRYPARSIWFPGRFFNFDAWVLVIRMQNGSVSAVRVTFS